MTLRFYENCFYKMQYHEKLFKYKILLKIEKSTIFILNAKLKFAYKILTTKCILKTKKKCSSTLMAFESKFVYFNWIKSFKLFELVSIWTEVEIETF